MSVKDIIQAIIVPDLWWSRSGIPGIIKATGQDTLDLIHRLSTNNCLNLPKHIGKQTILTNEKGRIIDVISVIQFNDHVLILTSLGAEQTVISWLKKFIIMEDIRFMIMNEDLEMLTLHGPQSLDFVSQFIGGDFLTLPMHAALKAYGSETRFAIRTMPLHELQYLIIDKKGSGLIDFFSHEVDIPEFNDIEWNRERILAGLGISEHEWSDAYNPLEAGLLHLIDFKKGCYIGQEVIARLDSYNKVNKRLMGISSDSHFSVNDPIFSGEDQIGTVTSICELNDAMIALGYIRSEHAYDDTKVSIKQGENVLEAIIHVLPMRK